MGESYGCVDFAEVGEVKSPECAKTKPDEDEVLQTTGAYHPPN